MDNSSRMKPQSDPHCRHRVPAEIISHAVWLYHVFSLSSCFWSSVVLSSPMRRGVVQEIGQSFANRLRHRRPRPGDKWALDGGLDPMGKALDAVPQPVLLRQFLALINQRSAHARLARCSGVPISCLPWRTSSSRSMKLA